MSLRRAPGAAAIAIPLVLWVSAARADEPKAFKHENTPENLKAFCDNLYQTIHIKNDARAGVALFMSLVPDEARAKKSLKSDLSEATLRSIADYHTKLTMLIAETKASDIVPAGRTEVKIYSATTEDILKKDRDSVAYLEFPGGAQLLAEKVLRPKSTFYEVEFLKPGEDLGIRYHLFFWDGKQWTMLGSLWRAVK